MCTLKQAEKQADAVFGILSILCGLMSLAGIAVYGEEASTGQLLFMIWVVVGSLVYPIHALMKE